MADVKGSADVEIAALANLVAPTIVTDGSRVAVRASRFGDLFSAVIDPDSGNTINLGEMGSLQVGPTQLVMSDFLGDSVESTRWTTTVAGSGTAASSNGEVVVQTSTTSASSALITSIEKLRYLPGVSYSFGCWARFNDTGVASSTRRIGVFTLSGTTPQDGYAFELNGTTFQIASYKAGTATTVASGSFTRNSTSPFTIDTNYHKYEIVFAASGVFFVIDGIIRHILTYTGISTPRTVTLILPVTIQSTNGAITTNELVAVQGLWIYKIGDAVRPYEIPHVVQNKVVQYTGTQTSTSIWTPATGKRIVVTSLQLQVGGTTAATCQLYFGSGAYSRGTSITIFDGEFAPSATLKPGVVMLSPPHGFKSNIDDILKFTDSAALNPVTINVWGYEE
jgi:hypothetical protein